MALPRAEISVEPDLLLFWMPLTLQVWEMVTNGLAQFLQHVTPLPRVGRVRRGETKTYQQGFDRHCFDGVTA